MSIIDRREAIKTACHLAKPGDIILLAGKGHEKYQEINGVRHHFDDKEVLMEQLNLIG
ncbi:UDP-N-acetylmuramoyl-L-alanyl-D-glutamate--2,6-diaminopimelate ligase [compost metagenome]